MYDGQLEALQPLELPALTQSETRWEILRISRIRPDHLEVCRGLLDRGWEPYGADEYGKHFRRRTKPTTGLVVVGVGHKLTARKAFPDWRIIAAPYTDKKALPAAVPRILMAWRPRTQSEHLWIRTALQPLLAKPGKLEWLV